MTLDDSLSQAHCAAGRAMFACQSMEVLFVQYVRLVHAQSHARELADVEALDPASFKTPTISLLRGLGADVDEEFASTLEDVIDRRHTLIHRWGLQRSFPVDTDIAGNQAVTEFSDALAADAVRVSAALLSRVGSWLQRFPELRETAESLNVDEIEASLGRKALRVAKVEQALPADGGGGTLTSR